MRPRNWAYTLLISPMDLFAWRSASPPALVGGSSEGRRTRWHAIYAGDGVSLGPELPYYQASSSMMAMKFRVQTEVEGLEGTVFQLNGPGAARAISILMAGPGSALWFGRPKRALLAPLGSGGEGNWRERE